jgi:hypothetical protein
MPAGGGARTPTDEGDGGQGGEDGEGGRERNGEAAADEFHHGFCS